ncbi:F-box protein CPR1-like [Cornus florida]|uniref:F-box protein CPR1-like n=1 Tax=Cornus florida TaxID=4283 RepID=UPI002896D338|nr:F-box protein CPR1-like [Cornus florida]
MGIKGVRWGDSKNWGTKGEGNIAKVSVLQRPLRVETFPKDIVLDILSRLPVKALGQSSSDRVDLISSCNGLVSMLVNFKTVFLLNPLTREFKKLPDHVFKWQYYGFGYDSFSDDYKVVLGSCEEIGNGYLESIVIKVYSLRSNCWKQIQQVMPHHIQCPNGVFANGAIHWEASRKGQNLSCHIVSFNLAEEKFKVVLQPNDGEEGCLFTLGILGGNLVMSRYGFGTVWTMEEYGVRESWTALLHFSPAEKPDSEYVLSPLCYKKNGGILLQNSSSHLVTYYRNGNSFVLSPFSIIEDELHVAKTKLHWYFESLVSPYSDNEKRRLHLA